MPQYLRYTFVPLSLLLIFCLSACAPMNTHSFAPAKQPYTPATEPVVGNILHMPTGVMVSEEQMLQAVTDTRIIYVGETHDNPASHRLELAVLKTLNERYPQQAALGMEMFPTNHQETVDQWLAGEITEKEFLKKTRFDESWGYEYYRDLLEYARDNRIPVIALNASKEQEKLLKEKGPEGLTGEDKDRLPEMDFSDPYHKALMDAFFADHSMGAAPIDRFWHIQVLRDEAMAESAVRFLSSEEGQNKRLLIIAGGNHVQYGFGIPRRVFRRLPCSYALVGSHSLVIPEEKKAQLMNVQLPDFPMTPFEYLTYTEYEVLERERVRLGVLLEDAEGQVAVKKVVPGSTAEKAGIEQGDILLSFEGEPLAENYDLIYLLKSKQYGDKGHLTIERQSEQREIQVLFEPMTHHTKE